MWLDIHRQKIHNHEVAKERSECEGLRHISFHSKKANWDAINAKLCEVNWNFLDQCKTVSEMLEVFITTCETVCKKYIPLKKDSAQK